ncbi:MAG: hypothetical protein Q4B80_00195 [Aerococcaceae bacterium]|nr:hypothetical protein [Aerococcaceae bacterium]
MKKRWIILSVMLGLLVLIGVSVNFLLGQTKDVASIETFAQVAKEQNLVVVDVTEQFANETHVKSAHLATPEQNEWQIEFFHVESDAHARAMFKQNKANFEAEKGNSSMKMNINIGNFNTFSMTANKTYYYLSRVDDTLIYVKADSAYKDQIKEFIKKLNY